MAAVKLSVLIPFRDQVELLNACLASLARFPFRGGVWEIILIDNGSRSDSLKKIQRPPSLTFRDLRVDEKFNFQSLNNRGAQMSSGEVLLCLNNDTEAIAAGWLDALYEKALDPQVGAVGCLLLYSDQSIQHAGVVVGLKGYAEHLYRAASLNAPLLPGAPAPLENRRLSAVTAACLAVERKKFDAVDGFDERFIVCGGDVDLCLRLHAAGWPSFYLGSVRALHHESKSRKGSVIPPSDFKESERSYSAFLQGKPDPYYPDIFSRRDYVPSPISPPSGRVGTRWQDIRRKRLQLTNALAHGGWARMSEILGERRRQGYSTRSLTYSWPKPLHYRMEPLRPKRRHYFIPHFNSGQTYGGIATLLEFALADALAGEFVNFVLLDAGGNFDVLAEVARRKGLDWKKIGHRFSAQRFDDQNEIELVGSPYDTFVASAWWTQLTLERGGIPSEKITSIIQDYEVLFYDEHDLIEKELRTLAASSYRHLQHVRINSRFLADFLFERKILRRDDLRSCEVFEPRVDRKVFCEDPRVPKRKQIFVYARPEVMRNRFDLCLAALKIAAPYIPLDWEICGLGTLRSDQDLGHGRKLKAMGKLSFADYVHFLKATPVGLCLMESPHPSYPPLELAACNGKVVCNRYAHKDYRSLGAEYSCVDLDAEALAQALRSAIEKVKL